MPLLPSPPPPPALSSSFLAETRKSSERAISLSLPCSPSSFRPPTVPLCPPRPGFHASWVYSPPVKWGPGCGGTRAGRCSGATMLGAESGARAWLMPCTADAEPCTHPRPKTWEAGGPGGAFATHPLLFSVLSTAGA